MILLKLFYVFLKISLFAIGGAYSFLPLIEREVVENYQWLTKGEFLDIFGMVGIFPGAISIKYATFVGYKLAGFPGVVAANLGNFLGPAIMVLCFVGVYRKYKGLPAVEGAFGMIRLAVYAMIIAVAFKLMRFSEIVQVKSLIVIISCFSVFLFTRIHPALIIVCAGVTGALMTMLRH